LPLTAVLAVNKIENERKMNALNKRTPDTSEFGGKRVLVTGGTKGAGRRLPEASL
jgi:hypothetical protein